MIETSTGPLLLTSPAASLADEVDIFQDATSQEIPIHGFGVSIDAAGGMVQGAVRRYACEGGDETHEPEPADREDEGSP
jgi:hypothetical protein